MDILTLNAVKEFRLRPTLKPPKEEIPPPYEEFDMLVFKAFDDVKFRLDNYAIGLQGRTNGSGYMIIYQGTEKRAPDADKMAKRTLDYLVKVRGIDPSRLTLIQGGQRLQTTIALYFVYPNGTIPVPSPR